GFLTEPMLRREAQSPSCPQVTTPLRQQRFDDHSTAGLLQLRERPIRVTEACHGNTHPVHQGYIQAARATALGTSAGIVEDAAGGQVSAAPTREQDRHLVGLVTVAVE